MDLWIKSLHVISVISWMAALLYLPRLFVYHCEASKGSDQSETFKTMEQRLLKAIATPAMIGSWVFGLWMATLYQTWSEVWFLAKFTCVLALTGMHVMYARHAREFRSDSNQKTSRYYRIINEIPAVLMIAIVIMVIVKPF